MKLDLVPDRIAGFDRHCRHCSRLLVHIEDRELGILHVAPQTHVEHAYVWTADGREAFVKGAYCLRPLCRIRRWLFRLPV